MHLPDSGCDWFPMYRVCHLYLHLPGQEAIAMQAMH